MNDNLDFTVLEDGREFAIIDEINRDNMTYVYLTSINDETDFVIRKLINDELIGLSNKDEFDKALLYFTEKNSAK